VEVEVEVEVEVVEGEVTARRPPHVEVVEEVLGDMHSGQAERRPRLVIGRARVQLEGTLTDRGARW